eukprot:SAG31_NODE_4488_length_3193_cov_5.386555_4_plen_117_part_00
MQTQSAGLQKRGGMHTLAVIFVVVVAASLGVLLVARAARLGWFSTAEAQPTASLPLFRSDDCDGAIAKSRGVRFCRSVVRGGRRSTDAKPLELGKGCYFLVFVPTVREIRDFYREM